MKLLRTKKRKVLKSVCHGDYEYKDVETFYIVEMSEEEYLDAHNTIHLNADEWRKLHKILNNVPETAEALKELMKGK